SATYTATGTLPAGFTLHADGSYTLDASHQAYQHLEAGHSEDITIPVTVTDGAGGIDTQTLTITLTGTNDAPIVTQPVVAQTATEDTGFSFALPSDTFNDVDNGDHLTLSATGLPSWLHFDAATGIFSGTPSNADVGKLPITVTATDSHGAQVSTSFALTVNNTNDAPVLTPLSTVAVTEDGAHASGQLQSTDPDVGDAQHLTYSVANSVDGFTLNSDGTWDFDPSHAAYQHIAAGISETVSIPVMVSDGHGGTDTQQLVINITGTNDNPVVSSTMVDGGHGFDEDTRLTSLSLVRGQLTATDVDTGDALKWEIIATHSDPNKGEYGHIALSPSGQWVYRIGSTDAAALSEGEQATETFHFKVSDGHGGSTTQTLTIHITGVNNAPIVVSHSQGVLPIAEQTTNQDSPFTFTLPADTFIDVDHGDHLTLSATGMPSWLHFDAATGTFSGTPTNSDVAGKLPITVTATDSYGAHVEASFALTVNNINDAPIISPISIVTVTEDGAHASGQLQATDPDVGDAQHLMYSVANAVDGFTLNNDGTWDFDPSHAAYQHIAAGVSESVSIPVTVSDGHGGTDTQQLVINITGTNDAPVITPGGDIENTLLVSRFQQSVLIQGQLVATDIDTNDQPKWEIVNPTGSHNPGSTGYGTFIISDDGRWFFRGGGSGGLARSLAEHETVDLPFTVQASDGHGGVVQQVVTVHVVGTNDAPTITHTVTAQSATEDTAFSFALPSDTFNDLDNGDHLTLSATGLPSWLHFDAATGTFSGTPSNADVGKLPITVTATDSQGARVSTSFALTVDNTNDAPTLTITQTTHITGTLVGSDVDVGDVLTYSSPNGVVDSTAHTTVVHGQFGDLTIDTMGGAYTYAPHSSAVGMAFDPATGIYSGHEVFEVVVTDSSGAAVSQFIQFDPTATVTAATTSGNPPVVVAQVPTSPTVTYYAMPTLPTITPPTNAVTISLDPASNSGDKTDLITSDTTPTITGHTDIPFSVVEIKDGTTVVATTTSDVNGDYSVTTSALSGSNSGDAHSLTATATAPSATTGVDSSGMVVTVDTGITAPTVDLVDASDSGSNHSDNLTNDTTPTFTLTGVDSDVTQVEVFDGSTSLGMATKVSGSTWTLTTDAAHELTANGHHDITAVVTDTQGNSVTSSPLTISLDTDRPMPPLMFDQITSDNVINAAESTGTVAVTGRVGGVLGQDFVSGDLMTIHLGGKDYQGSVDSSGAFSIDIPGSELAANHAYSASFAAHDNAGNASSVNRVSTSYAVDTDATTASDTDTATEDQAAGVTHGNVLTNDDQGLTVTNTGDKIGTYGTLHLQADGSYTFDLNNNHPAVQGIPAGQTVTDSYTYEVTDAAGNTAQQTLTITITGTNDIPIFAAIPSVSVTEDAAKVTGQLQANDFDAGANQHLTYTASQQVDGFTLNADGSWSFDPSHASYQHLAKGVSETISIPVSVTDGEGGTSHSTLTIDITGANDSPYLIGTVTRNVDEGGHLISSHLLANDIDDGDTIDAITFSLDPAQPPVAGFTLNPTDGSYTFDPSDPAYNYLAAGEKLDIVIPITCTGSSGESSTQTHAITFHLTGTNDAPTVQHDSVKITAPEGTTPIVLTADNFGNPIDVDTTDTLSVDITDTHEGTIQLDAHAVSKVSLADIQAGKVTFKGAAHTASTDSANFTYKIDDGHDVSTVHQTAVHIDAHADGVTLTGTTALTAGSQSGHTETIVHVDGNALHITNNPDGSFSVQGSIDLHKINQGEHLGTLDLQGFHPYLFLPGSASDYHFGNGLSKMNNKYTGQYMDNVKDISSTTHDIDIDRADGIKGMLFANGDVLGFKKNSDDHPKIMHAAAKNVHTVPGSHEYDLNLQVNLDDQDGSEHYVVDIAHHDGVELFDAQGQQVQEKANHGGWELTEAQIAGAKAQVSDTLHGDIKLEIKVITTENQGGAHNHASTDLTLHMPLPPVTTHIAGQGVGGSQALQLATAEEIKNHGGSVDTPLTPAQLGLTSHDDLTTKIIFTKVPAIHNGHQNGAQLVLLNNGGETFIDGGGKQSVTYDDVLHGRLVYRQLDTTEHDLKFKIEGDSHEYSVQLSKSSHDAPDTTDTSTFTATVDPADAPVVDHTAVATHVEMSDAASLYMAHTPGQVDDSANNHDAVDHTLVAKTATNHQAFYPEASDVSAQGNTNLSDAVHDYLQLAGVDVNKVNVEHTTVVDDQLHMDNSFSHNPLADDVSDVLNHGLAAHDGHDAFVNLLSDDDHDKLGKHPLDHDVKHDLDTTDITHHDDKLADALQHSNLGDQHNT
ncbi:hypothetical protein E2R68_09360, partial [Psychromonas sp. RZ22]|uniref:VCBS domain-containing protein n=1 Tax=Psychromonas algarum TaxID=2555643 RepID=UPI0010684719